MIKRRNLFLSMIILILLLSIFILCFIQYYQWKQSFFKQSHTSLTHSARTVSITPKDFHTSAVIGAIGDILIHDWVYDDARTQSGYDFKPMFQPVKAMLQKPDLLIANQESIPGGEKLGISSYPAFNSPYEIVDAIMDAGVDLVSTANNHALDKGEKGILSSISYYENKQLPYVGTFKDVNDQQKIRVQSVNGIKIAVLAYTYGTNGIPVPDGKDYLVNLINKDTILFELKRARQVADLVILNLHWGIEYNRQPNEDQKMLAKLFTDGGADIILGHHPHVLQPVEKFHTRDGRDAYVIYSLGNFISGQMWDYKDIGGMIEFKVSKNILKNEKQIKIEDRQFHPTYVANQNLRQYRVYPLQEAYEKGLINHTYDEIINYMMSN
ncbi:CapA family protein [Heyndrickxia oleronia]|uniref:Capsular biosynthesis protein n=1 Tax=Heyndrickxia oleronia TaxID=38875 RepID=A0A8E2I685_9BACI|nr:CapA family protein [Heyndrickxia oleronia]NYV64969.1 CapA family protein [Bacillus sp. Gen3]OJH19457.1 capsular biosynthesis protein [Bacillus obstructivus]MEC1374254.1 CapA family protein [Heyndrickxia oleronia]OOP67491.1 capsular biosynthesis protein [Heyndrickxia oleronia]QQZ07148.1 CapA family protein [Heyndrickxia oleronia]